MVDSYHASVQIYAQMDDTWDIMGSWLKHPIILVLNMYFTITVFFNQREQKKRDSSSPVSSEGWSAVSDTFFLTTAARTPQVGRPMRWEDCLFSCWLVADGIMKS